MGTAMFAPSAALQAGLRAISCDVSLIHYKVC